jgi:hypothetical protein
MMFHGSGLERKSTFFLRSKPGTARAKKLCFCSKWIVGANSPEGNGTAWLVILSLKPPQPTLDRRGGVSQSGRRHCRFPD